MASEKILALVLAGGQDLYPITINRMKASIALGGYRLVDFVLSNLVNSGIDSIYLLAEHDPEILIGHIQNHWVFATGNEKRFIKVVQPKRGQGEYFLGTADVIYRNIDLIERHAPDLVAVFAADQVYRMDVRQMVAYHRECGAEATIAAVQVPIAHAPWFDIIGAGHHADVWSVQEKPDVPIPLPFDSAHAYASMGNYLFKTGVLLEGLEETARHGETDFLNLLSRLVRSHRVYAYDFSCNQVPGIQPNEEHYWREMGSLQAYIDAAQDISGLAPRFRLHNPQWPIFPLHGQPPPIDEMDRDALLSRIDMMQLESRLVYH